MIDAVNQLRAAAITDLIVDLRYNGGGFLDIASVAAYMIAGAGPTAGRVFEDLSFNDKHPATNPVTGQPLTPTPFHTTSQGFSGSSGQALPTLDLFRVFVLSGPNTCSASESIMNGLRGVDVEVIQIGRNQAPLEAVEDMAAALWWNSPDELVSLDGGRLQDAERGHRMADGSLGGRIFKEAVHPEPKVQAIMEQGRERQAVQGIDRIRPVRAVEPKRVWILCDLPMPITVDELVTWDGLLLRARLATELATNGVLPLSAKHIAQYKPRLFTPGIAEGQNPTVRAVQIALAKARLTLKAHRNDPTNYLVDPFRCAFALFRTRAGGPERLALIWRDCADPKAALTQALGEVVKEFRFETETVQPGREAGERTAEERASLGWGLHTLVFRSKQRIPIRWI